VTRGQDSRLALGRLGALVEQLETLVRGGREVILVTSGLSKSNIKQDVPCGRRVQQSPHHLAVVMASEALLAL